MELRRIRICITANGPVYWLGSISMVTSLPEVPIEEEVTEQTLADVMASVGQLAPSVDQSE